MSTTPPTNTPATPRKSGLPGWAIAVLVATVAIPILLVILGVVSSLAIYGFRRYLAAAKSAEARASVARMAKDAATAYERERVDGVTTETPVPSHRLCASASKPVPASLDQVSGRKYRSSPSEWQVDASRNAGFACLGFSMSDAQYYQYMYEMNGTGEDASSFSAIAKGDLNGDGIASYFCVTGRVELGERVAIEPLVETLPEE
jgi:type II secretory pathway pseudopilin PulG